MPTDIVIPEVGESVSSGVIAAWTKGDGEWVERDETVIELETDKVTMEIPAPAGGVLKHGAAEGDEVEVGAVVGSIDESAERPAGSGSVQQAATAQKAEAQAGASANGQASDASADTATVAPPEPDRAAVVTDRDTSRIAGEDDTRATPLARKLARENEIDLTLVTGTGPGGRIREQDVLAAISSGPVAEPEPEPDAAEAAGPSRATSLQRMSPLRQRIATRLVQAQQTAAMLTTFNECDMSAVMALRKQHKEAFAERHGIGLGFMSFFVKACASALRAFPLINSYITAGEDGQPSVLSHDYCDIAIAVSSPKGLVVPVLRNAETLSFAEIEARIKDFGTRARDGKLELAEMQGGTFTITNGGVFGSLMSTPILNPPQSGILGMHAIKNRAVEDPKGPGQAVIRPMMYLALSYDHRIVDGAEAVQFLVHIKSAIEDPARLMLEL